MARDRQRILILRLSALGDCVLASAVVDALHGALPGSSLSFLVKRTYVPLFEEDARIERVVPYPVGSEGLAGLVRVVQDLRRMELDLLVDLHGTPRSMLIGLLAGARKRTVWSKQRFEREFLVRFHRGSVTPVVQRYLECAARGTGMRLTGRPALLVSPGASSGVDDRLVGLGIGPAEEIALVCPGARHSTKQWTIEGFADVANRTAACYGLRTVLAGDASDRGACVAVRSSLAGGAADLSGQLSLGEFIALVGRSRLVVCNDSAPMHIATSLGVPVVAVFGPTHPGLGFAPVGEGASVARLKVSCSPCSLHGDRKCHRSRRVCMEDLTTDQVMSHVGSSLQARAPRSRNVFN